MSKKIVTLKTVVDFFCSLSTDDINKIEKDARKLFKKYDPYSCIDEFGLELCALDKNNLNIWLGLKNFIEREIKNTELEILFNRKYKLKNSHVKSSMQEYLSQTSYYNRIYKIYIIAIKYICYHHLVKGEQFEYN